MMSARGFLAVACVACCVSGGASGLAAEPTSLTQPQLERVRQISDYVNSLTTLQGRFTQIGPGGNFTEGEFFLQRPGKIRFDYAPPNPVLVISDGWWVGIEDRKKKRTEKYPLATTPLSILLDDEVDLVADTKIVAFDESEDVVSLTLEDSVGTATGLLTLYFGKPDLSLQQWTVIDAQGLQTEVSLFDLVKGGTFEPSLFRIDDNVTINNERGNK